MCSNVCDTNESQQGFFSSHVFHGPGQQVSVQQIPFPLPQVGGGMSGRQGNDGHGVHAFSFMCAGSESMPLYKAEVQDVACVE